MDNDVVCSASDSSEESLSEELFHDSIEARRDNNLRYSNDDNDDETEIKSRSRSNLVLDLRNVPTVANIVKSDDETSSLKLSAVIEQPEEHVTNESNGNEETESLDNNDLDKILRERINTLQQVIIDLRAEVKLALSLWRKERDEFQLLRERSDILAVEEATAAARAAAEAYAAESPLSNELGNMVDLNPVQSLSELTILEYEKKLAKYQDALALAQAEKRYNMRRKMIANTYRHRLVEVERMCNDELEKIRESANILQPLRQMASQWSITKDGNRNEAIIEWNQASMKSDKQLAEIGGKYDRDTRNNGIVDDEVNMIPELVAARFSYAEASKYDRHGAVRSAKSASQSHLLAESNSLPSTWYASSSKC